MFLAQTGVKLPKRHKAREAGGVLPMWWKPACAALSFVLPALVGGGNGGTWAG